MGAGLLVHPIQGRSKHADHSLSYSLRHCRLKLSMLPVIPIAASRPDLTLDSVLLIIPMQSQSPTKYQPKLSPLCAPDTG